MEVIGGLLGSIVFLLGGIWWTLADIKSSLSGSSRDRVQLDSIDQSLKVLCIAAKHMPTAIEEAMQRVHES